MPGHVQPTVRTQQYFFFRKRIKILHVCILEQKKVLIAQHNRPEDLLPEGKREIKEAKEMREK